MPSEMGGGPAGQRISELGQALTDAVLARRRPIMEYEYEVTFRRLGPAEEQAFTRENDVIQSAASPR